MSGTPLLSIFASFVAHSVFAPMRISRAMARRAQLSRMSVVGMGSAVLLSLPILALAQTDDGSRSSQPPRTSLTPGAVRSPFAVGVGAAAAQVVQGVVSPIVPAGREPTGHTLAPPNPCNGALTGALSGGLALPLVTVRRRVVVLGTSGGLPPHAVPAPVVPPSTVTTPAENIPPRVMVDHSVGPAATATRPESHPVSAQPYVADASDVRAAAATVSRTPEQPPIERGLMQLTPETGDLVVARLTAAGGLQRREAPPTDLQLLAQRHFDAAGVQDPQPLFGERTPSAERQVALGLAHRVFKVLASNPKLGAVIHVFEPPATVGQFVSLVVLAVSAPDAAGNFAVQGVLPNGVVQTFFSKYLASLTPEVAGQFLVGPLGLDLARIEGEALKQFQKNAQTARNAAGGWVRSVNTAGQGSVAKLPPNPFLLLPPPIAAVSPPGTVPPQVQGAVRYLIDLARGAAAVLPVFPSLPGIIYSGALSPPRFSIAPSPNSGRGPTLINPWEGRPPLPTDGAWPIDTLRQLSPVDPAVEVPRDVSVGTPPPRSYQEGVRPREDHSSRLLAQLVSSVVAEAGKELELVVLVARQPVDSRAQPTYERAVVRGRIEQVRPGPNGTVVSVVVRDAAGRVHEISAGDLLWALPRVAQQEFPPISLSAVVPAGPDGVRYPAQHQIHEVNRDWFDASMAAFEAGAVVRVRITDVTQFPGQLLVAGQAAGVTGQFNTSVQASGQSRPVRGVGPLEAAYSYLTGEAPRSASAQSRSSNSVRPDAPPSAVEFSAVVAGVFWEASLGKWFVHFRELPPAAGESSRTVGLLAAPLDEALAVSVSRLNPGRVFLVLGEATPSTTFGFRSNGLGAQEAIAAVRARIGQVVFWGGPAEGPIEGQPTGVIELPPLTSTGAVRYRVHFRPITGIDPRGEFILGPGAFRDFLAHQLSQLVPLAVVPNSWRAQRAQRLRELGLGARPSVTPSASHVASYGVPFEPKVALVSQALTERAPIRLLFPAAVGEQWFQYEGNPSRITVERADDGQVYVLIAFVGPVQWARIAGNNVVEASRVLPADSAPEVRIRIDRLQAGHVQILTTSGRTGGAGRP